MLILALHIHSELAHGRHGGETEVNPLNRVFKAQCEVMLEVIGSPLGLIRLNPVTFT